jgi:VWFA-related protein
MARRIDRLRIALAGLAVVLAVGLGGAAPVGVGGQQPPAAGQQPPAAGQQPPAAQQPPTFRAGVRVVRVDATVLGKGDVPVADLKADDFEVSEDGVPQRVDTCQFLRLTGQPTERDDTSLEIRSREHAEAEAAREDVRLFVIFLDDYHIDKLPSITIPLRRDLSAFINRLQPTDLVAIVDPLTPADTMTFTRDKQAMLDVIRTFEGRQGEIFPVRSAVEEAQLQSGDVVRLRAQVTLSALASDAIRLGGLREGRKTIIFVSQGPPLNLPSANLEEDFREVVVGANRANVTINCVDPRGLSVYGRFAMDSIYRLAAETGGRTITNTNDMAFGLQQVVNDASAYYLLGYTPTRSEDDGKYHRISVKVKRPGTHVIARPGYWAPSQKQIDAAAALANRPVVPGVPAAMKTFSRLEPRGAVQVWVGMTRTPEGRSAATVTWEPSSGTRDKPVERVEIETILSGAKAPSGPVRILSATASAPGRPRATFELAPGDMVFRFTARDQSGTVIDRWEQPFSVPDLSAPVVALSTPRFYIAPSLADWRALQAAADPVPSAVRVFRQTDRILVEVDCYRSQPTAEPAVDVALLSAEGQDLAPLTGPTPVQGKLRFELPIRGLGKGTYILRIRAKVGDAQAEQLVTFRVTP